MPLLIANSNCQLSGEPLSASAAQRPSFRPFYSDPSRSQAHAFLRDILHQSGILCRVGMLPFIHLHGKRRDLYTILEQHCHIGIAIGPMRAARTTPIEDRARYVVARGDQRQQMSHYFLCFRVDIHGWALAESFRQIIYLARRLFT